MEIILCPECGVPEQITKNHIWLNSGALVQGYDLSTRLCFMECENLDPLYRGIGEIIGLPIDHLVIDIILKAAANYVANIIPFEVKNMVKSRILGAETLIGALSDIAQLYGYGRYEFIGVRYEGGEDDYLAIRVKEPYSVLLCCGSFAGSIEAIVDAPQGVTYSETSPEVYEIKAFASEYSREVHERLQLERYHHRDGDIELERCPTCGGPKALSGNKWYPDRGVVANALDGRRMALIGPGALGPVFQELEKELGESIPHAVVEMQRRFAKQGFYSIKEIGDEENLRTQLAVRGLGNLREMSLGPGGLQMRIASATGHLMLAGLVQGLFERSFDVDTRVEWRVSEGGDLEIEVSP